VNRVDPDFEVCGMMDERNHAVKQASAPICPNISRVWIDVAITARQNLRLNIFVAKEVSHSVRAIPLELHGFGLPQQNSLTFAEFDFKLEMSVFATESNNVGF
jgi:hypothetical protein